MPYQAIELHLNRIHVYVLKVMQFPESLQANHAEFQSVMQAWASLGRLVPGFAKTSAEEFAAMLRRQAAKSYHERMAFAKEWRPSNRAPWPLLPSTAKKTTGAVLTGLVEPTMPPPSATESQLYQYQRDLERFNRVLMMLTKLANMRHEMMKSVAQNLRG